MVSFLLVGSCRFGPPDSPHPKVEIKALQSWSLSASSGIGYPRFLLSDGLGGFVCGGERELLRIAQSGASLHVEPVSEKPYRAIQESLGRIVAASQGFDGTQAFLGESGLIAIRQLRSGRDWAVSVREQSPFRHIAVSRGAVYLLLEGFPATGNAVAAYNFQGVMIDRWGSIAEDGILQASLSGGGIAACPDGSVFYSYINSPQVLRLTEEDAVQPIGPPRRSFQVLSGRQIRSSLRESLDSHSVAPAVRLGLSASRVMSLLCSEDGLLFREVAQPHGKGAQIEVWDPMSGQIIALIKSSGTLMAVRDNVLFISKFASDGQATLERIRYHAQRFESERAGKK